MKNAAILLAEGFEEIETLVPYDLLKRAGIHTQLVSVENTKTVTGANGLVVEADVLLRGYDFLNTDCLIVPGGPGAEKIGANELLRDEITAFAANPYKVLGAICAGAALIGKLGLLKDRRYTCPPDLNSDSFGGTYEKKHAVTDQNVVTGIYVGGAFEFAFDLIDRLESHMKADELKEAICYTL